MGFDRVKEKLFFDKEIANDQDDSRYGSDGKCSNAVGTP